MKRKGGHYFDARRGVQSPPTKQDPATAEIITGNNVTVTFLCLSFFFYSNKIKTQEVPSDLH